MNMRTSPKVMAMEEHKNCVEPGCGKPAGKKGLCYAHYRRYRLYGSATGGGTSWGQPAEFIKNVALPFRSDECLVWPFSRTPAGYPKMGNKLVSRIVCELVHGKCDKRSYALHSCGNGHLGCVNPRHLRWGSQSQNADDAREHGVLPLGEANGQSKLTAEAARYIKSMRGVVGQTELARQFGVSNVTIHDIHHGKTWTWL